MKLADYRKQFTPQDAPGFAAILDAMKTVYPVVKPDNWAPQVPSWMGGASPLDNISIYPAEYNGECYYHFVTYGFSQLYYDEQVAANEISKFGFELTFRLKPFPLDEGNPSWVIDLLQNIARYIFEKGIGFDEHHILPTNSPLRLDCDTPLNGLVFDLDPQLGVIDTPHGKVKFLQMYGVNGTELDKLINTDFPMSMFFASHKQNNPLLITDLERGVKRH